MSPPLQGAPLDALWSQQAGYGSRASPGSAAKKNAPKCDPLCDLYDKGYSTAFDDIMDAYSSGDMVYAGEVSSRKKTGSGANHRHGHARAGGDFKSDPATSDADFYDEDETTDADKPPPKAHRHQSGVVHDHDRDSDSDSDSDDDAPKHKHVAKRKDPKPREDVRPALRRHSVHDNSSSARDELSTHALLPIALYIVSGVLLIFMMEQFVQMGMRMRQY
jgi:hypothetical protein